MAVKKAFSLVELTIVIVVLAIVFGISINASFNIYKNYIQTQTFERVSSEAERALDVLTFFLSQRAKQSVIARKDSENFLPIDDEGVNDGYDTIEYVAYDLELFNDGFYSAIVDLNASSHNNGLVSPGSKFQQLIDYYSWNSSGPSDDEQELDDDAQADQGKVQFDKNFDVIAVFSGVNYSVNDFGYNGAKPNITKVKYKDNERLQLEKQGVKVSEFYHLSYTAQAIKIIDNETTGINKDTDLVIYHNYRPWNGENYTQGEMDIIARHVSSFRFKAQNGSIMLKICLRDNQDEFYTLGKNKNFDFTVCRSRIVM
ncbi:hypothetical protein LMG7974_00790 [Campylobacter majalis]|uniref:Prepilin-type N-terminal cleavage/methylation domain-containing protein n=1 Tax=Campylobacter majalis TaxID=2790656 RepID=A0ABN7K602_9BACT|nr:prepilin-type N-terminal cleavage/methylation domain-containing protein [Campylobacter majalis]CAD7287946.1 hypothetical protein LMG7974_00790 [Campylobacter majalis]